MASSSTTVCVCVGDCECGVSTERIISNDVLKAKRVVECPMCLDEFDNELNIPTTLICGHSLCLRHLRGEEMITLQGMCVTCRQPFGCTEFAPNYTLRDTVMEYKRACAILERKKYSNSSSNNADSRRRPVIVTEKSVLAFEASIDASCSVM